MLNINNNYPNYIDHGAVIIITINAKQLHTEDVFHLAFRDGG